MFLSFTLLEFNAKRCCLELGSIHAARSKNAKLPAMLSYGTHTLFSNSAVVLCVRRPNAIIMCRVK